VLIGLGLILIAVLIGPILIKPVERNIEVFFLAVGAVTAVITGQFGWRMVDAALTEPLALTIAVGVFGVLAQLLRPVFDQGIQRLRGLVSGRWIYFTLILVLGAASSVITSVVAALLLVEAIAMLKLDRPSETAAVVLACFAIGLGSALTPMGGPLAAIAIAALGADFWYLTRLLAPLVAAGIVIVAALSLFIAPLPAASLYAARPQESWRDIAMRTVRVYAFVAGLVALAWGMRPLANVYVPRLPQGVLFWVNSISAVVDNATLTAAEIGPALNHGQQRAILMGLLISGGMLIPGNIPNIVAANRLGIASREWAGLGLIIGLPLMLVCFAVLHWLG
jgi:predicted cation transporter